jgi:hypothetical protein
VIKGRRRELGGSAGDLGFLDFLPEAVICQLCVKLLTDVLSCFSLSWAEAKTKAEAALWMKQMEEPGGTQNV